MANILIVDDEKSIRRTFELFLTKENHNVFLAENAEIAFNILDKNSIDLVLTDIIMPKITGIEMFERIKENNPDMPIIIMTGEPSVNTAKTAVKGGAMDYLIKPVNKDDLLKTVAYALHRKELIDSKKALEEKNAQYRKHLEEVVTEKTQALQAAKALVDLSPTPTIILNREDDTIFNINKAMLDCMKIKNTDGISNHFPFKSQEDYEKIKNMYYEKGKLDNVEIELQRHGSNEKFWCVLSIHPIKLSRQDLLIISVTDLNDMIETQKQLQQAKQKAEAATKAKSEFLANMSHEIRTPMNAIIGLSTLIDKTVLTAKQKDYVHKLNISAKNLLNIINDILDFSKLESGKLNIEQIEFNLDDILENIATIISFSAYKKGLDFLIKKDKNVPNLLIGDPLRLGQVLLNLSNNAVKFTEKGEVYISILNLKETDSEVKLRFSVQDTGIGISKENQKKLFEAFTQADASITRKYGGSGLGLAISQSIISMMGGKIGFDSEYGKGSQFFFTVNFKKANNAVSTIVNIPSKIMDLNILIADDSQSNIDIISYYLEELHQQPVSVNTFEKAVNEIKSNEYDIVMIDKMMQSNDNEDKWNAMLDIVSEKGIKPIMLQPYCSNEDEYYNDDNTDFIISKPCTQSEIYNTIVRTIGPEIRKHAENSIASNINCVKNEKTGKILLVEDSEINQLVTQEMLKYLGYTSDIAENGKVAINKALKNDYDLILMDLQMPVMDGYLATHKIREYGITIPIIALSAETMGDIKNKVIDAGMDDYMSKPIDNDNLEVALDKWMKAIH